MKTIKIEVTQDDIDNGLQGNCISCPIGRAINRLLNQNYFGRATYDLVKIHSKPSCGVVYVYPMPIHGGNFITSFDKCYKVKPFSFDIDIPEIFLK